ncbi:unnamed protein product [Rotaria sordida]|uniref:Carboxyltransferase domain-containing protein n=1 Tax=Rotaria sordida TaxID=392033 RepID=A0A815T1V7_9BILA|nr:unnamed protein product [Rotaria sordida]
MVIVISLIEYGDSKSAINLLLRMRIHQIQEYLGLITDLKTIKTKPILNSLIDSVPAIRSLLICYDPMHLSQNILIKYLQTIEKLVNDYWNNHAIQYYMKTIRSKVNYLPDNLKFIANNNGIIGENNIEQISNILLNAQWLVIDYRTKYNPARTYTPGGSCGLDGIYMTIYSIESSDGYQLIQLQSVTELE